MKVLSWVERNAWGRRWNLQLGAVHYSWVWDRSQWFLQWYHHGYVFALDVGPLRVARWFE